SPAPDFVISVLQAAPGAPRHPVARPALVYCALFATESAFLRQQQAAGTGARSPRGTPPRPPSGTAALDGQLDEIDVPAAGPHVQVGVIALPRRGRLDSGVAADQRLNF